MSTSSSFSQIARILSLTPALLLACSVESGRPTGAGGDDGVASLGAGTGDGTGAEGSTAGETAGGDDSDSGTNDSGTDGPKFDLASVPGGSDVLLDGECQNVDLLFVIDNSGSMQDEQASLVASFGGFVAGVQAALESAESYHIGVVTTDSYSSNAAGCRNLGALVTSTGGNASSNTNCLPFASGMRYLDDTEPDLTAKFSCIAQVGTSGSGSEIQAEAGYRAVSPNLNAVGACNEGFVREDALLVVVIITDEDDKESCSLFGCSGGSSGNPSNWFQKFVEYKSGIEENIVVLALVGGPNNSCGAQHCSRLINMTSMFTNGFVGDICAPSYELFFNDAINVIDDACINFKPPG